MRRRDRSVGSARNRPPHRGSDCIDLESVKRESTPVSTTKLAIRLHSAKLSFYDTTSIIGNSGTDRCRSTVDDSVRRTDRRSTTDIDPGHVAVMEPVIRPDYERYWPYTAMKEGINCLLFVRSFPTKQLALTETFRSGSTRSFSSRRARSRWWHAVV